MDRDPITPTPHQLRALAHPVRLRMLGMLRMDGPATATSLATRLGLNTGATSYHLRQLAQHGFITDDETRGNGRERWWRAAHASTRTDWEPADIDPEEQETRDAYLQTVAVVYSQMLQQAVEVRSSLAPEWRNAWTISDWRAQLTPDKARRLIELLSEDIEEFEEVPSDDPDSLPYVVMLHAFPRPGGFLGHSGDLS